MVSSSLPAVRQGGTHRPKIQYTFGRKQYFSQFDIVYLLDFAIEYRDRNFCRRLCE